MREENKQELKNKIDAFKKFKVQVEKDKNVRLRSPSDSEKQRNNMNESVTFHYKRK